MLRRVRQSLRQVLFLMARRPDLVCGAIVLSVLLILAVKFTCSRAKNVVAAARPPVRFFSAETPVVDLYLGQLDQVERLRGVAEVSLIFFYAPWCAHSMAARQEVQQVAKKLAKQVQFVAVNCWWSQGKCRKQNRLFQYPVIHLFYRRFGPIEYKGPFIAPYVESFVRKVITPLIYLPSRATLQDFLANHEPGVVGFFQFNSSPQPPGYITYLSSALQALKRDFRGVVRFGVVTNRQVAEAISVKEDETVYLHRRFNSSLIFPRQERNFTSEGICSWVFEHCETVLQWLQPPGTKSRLLEQELTKGPALLLFLSHNPLGSKPNPILQQMADIAVRYHSCDNNYHSSLDRSGIPLSHSVCCQSVVLPGSSSSVCELCLSLSRPSSTSSSIPCSFPSVAQGGAPLQSYLKHCCLHRPPAPVSVHTATSVACCDFLSSYSPFGQYSACCRKLESQLNKSSSQEGSDSQSVPLAPPSSSVPLSSVPSQEGGSITGLRCQTNKTLRFYVLDVALNWPLALRLGAPRNGSASYQLEHGVQGDKSANWSFATIVNLKDEVHYVHHHNPATTLTESLEVFIRNFSAAYSPLQRHLVGEEDSAAGEGAAPPPARPLITELTTSSFLPSVMDLQKDVLLFYYTQWCGFCSALNHIIIQLARLLQGNSTITVARVNVARNDLPWEFMVDHVPSVLLFPRYRKHLSVKFPDDVPITLPNLLRFVLQHSSSARDAPGSAKPPSEAEGPGPNALLRAEFLALQGEVHALHRARERLSQQLAQLWRDNRRLTFDTRTLEAQNAELQRERQSLEEQHREKSRQLGEAVRRLQELADTSENLLNENMLLRVLLRALKDRTEVKEELDGKDGEQKRNHMAS
ncbi:thioredoxin domain-containing protein 11 [Myripristis murdjan]|uniref:Thioredoxin domain containing 11 n=1 Tax=Myripristis murdjan TaxID=586833 RepID=A0A667WSX8_9TELE|nr:thioredoxin domain-containing protein 11 [Myripristis murdjan]XP_029916237.1 thioredoxin domain-containing protein 11 [Myripristis murdjan]